MDGNAVTKKLTYKGTCFFLDGQPFHLQGVSFFNAIFNPSMHESDEVRLGWIKKFQSYGISLIRVWCQWDFTNMGFVDTDPDRIMYTPEGDVREEWFRRLEAVIRDCDSLGMVVEVALFSHEKEPKMPLEAMERATAQMTERLKPYRNLILQIWNEDDYEAVRYYRIAKRIDPQRIVTNSPGFPNVLGSDGHNETMDILTPHTIRGKGPFWKQAPEQIKLLLERFNKPVIDDEPARNGTVNFGGIEGGTMPEHHIEQIRKVRENGGYHIYHHDMFQLGYGDPSIPPNGIPDPEFSEFHRVVFDYLRLHPTW